MMFIFVYILRFKFKTTKKIRKINIRQIIEQKNKDGTYLVQVSSKTQQFTSKLTNKKNMRMIMIMN